MNVGRCGSGSILARSVATQRSMLRGVTITERPQTASRTSLRASARPGLRCEVGQQTEFLGRQFHFPALAEEFAGGQIQFEIAKRDHGRLLRLAPAQERVGASHQLADAERLGDVVVGAQVQPQDDVFFLALGRQHQDGHFQAMLVGRARQISYPFTFGSMMSSRIRSASSPRRDRDRLGHRSP